MLVIRLMMGRLRGKFGVVGRVLLGLSGLGSVGRLLARGFGGYRGVFFGGVVCYEAVPLKLLIIDINN